MERFYAAFDSFAEVSGELMTSMMDCANSKNIVPILQTLDLPEIHPEAWHQQQLVLDVFSTVKGDSSDSMFNLVSIGMRLMERLKVPETVQIVDYESILRSQDIIYQSYHRLGDVGHHYVVKLEEQFYRWIADTPYPTDFEFGVLHGQVKRFMPPDVSHSIRFDDGFMRKEYGQGAKMLISWE